MLSAVFINLYMKIPGKPAISNQNNGATYPSLKFSDKLSIAPLVTALSSYSSTFRETIFDKFVLALRENKGSFQLKIKQVRAVRVEIPKLQPTLKPR